MNTVSNFVVIGAGHGGKAMAAHLSLMGNFSYRRHSM
jgi:cation diffusion facilitator CzcD-associated flavoprotein CzcO